MAAPCVPDAAAEANQAIREFMAARTGRGLWSDEQAEYERLLAAWAAASAVTPIRQASTIS
ncbi:hypothetical protein ACWGJW_07680 [Streptomyces nigrescens]